MTIVLKQAYFPGHDRPQVRDAPPVRDSRKAGQVEAVHGQAAEELLARTLEHAGHRRGPLLQSVGTRFQAGL